MTAPAAHPTLEIERRAVLRGVAFAVAVGVLLLLIAWRAIPEAPQPGLDPSWQAGLHMSAHGDLRWGRDLLLTYGPLGWLRIPTYWYEDSGRIALLYVVATRVAVFAVLWALGRRLFGWFGALLVLLPVAWAVDDPIQLLGAIGAMLLAARGADWPPRLQYALVAALGATAGWELLGKINVGILVGATTVAALCFAGSWARFLRLAAAFAASFGVALTVLWIATGQALGALPSYLRGAAQMVSGYSEAMGIEDPSLRWQFWVFAAIVGVGAALGYVLSSGSRRQRLGACAVWLVTSFLVFKAGFVRHDIGHSFIPFVTLGPLALAFAWRLTLAGRIAALLMVLVPIGCFLGTAKVPLRAVVDPVNHAKLARQQLSGIYDWQRRRTIREQGLQAVFAADGLSLPALDAVKGHTVDAWPWEAAVVWAYRFDWDPQPVFQGYQAYRSALDRLNARRLASAQAPERLIVGPNVNIDGRTPSFDTPLVAREILCRYAPLVQQDQRWLILGRTDARCTPPRLLQTRDVAWNAPIAVPAPPADGIVFMVVHGAGVEGIERIRTALYRSLDRGIDLGTAGGVRRLTPDTIVDGLPLRSGDHVDFPVPYALAPDARTVKLDRSDHPRGGQPLEVSFYVQRVITPTPPAQPRRKSKMPSSSTTRR